MNFFIKNMDIKSLIKKLPDAPGVYIFRGQPKRSRGLGKILYIGKATSLRDRVRSYMSKGIFDTRSPLIEKMLGQFDAIEHIKTDSVLEALVLEAHLIKKHQPEANIKEKDNKSFNFVIITRENFPRVLIVRGRELLQHHISKNKSTTIYCSGLGDNKIDDISSKFKKEKLEERKGMKIGYSFGPFPNSSQLKEAMKIVRKMFPYRDSKCIPCIDRLKKKKTNDLTLYDISYSVRNKLCKPCFNRQIGLCPGVCIGEITQEQYTEQIKNIILFFEGNKKRLVKNLQVQMKSFAENKEFEKANITKHTLFTLNHIQDISLIKEESKGLTLRLGSQGQTLDSGFRIESYDIAHLSGTNVVGVMTVVEDGEIKKSEYRKFKIRDNPGVNDTKALSEVLSRRLAHIEWRLPDLIVVDGGTAQRRLMERILRENKLDIPVVSVVKDEHHRPKQILGDKKHLMYEREILLSNSEAHRFAITFHKQLRNKL
ncbi:MAG: hypothetical protein A3C63_02960 [Candidatus Zambryskibacteria bacterium RIFCSPHIGHO2_02_FULL_39_82]|nr:MAG: hypothetical protein A3C63_02960 [Candidatus Zambryskibacteria bacterium RIFCSPHIGHO2_02_FULL_39_82]